MTVTEKGTSAMIKHKTATIKVFKDKILRKWTSEVCLYQAEYRYTRNA